MTPDQPSDRALWEQGWEGHSAAQRRRLADLSLIEKLEWLEQAQRVADHLARDRRRGPGGTPEAAR